MMCLLTERWLTPGSFEEFRRAWEPDEQPEILVRAYHLRDPRDPDHVISFGLFDLTPEAFAEVMASPELARMQERRMAAMAPFVTRTGVDGAFEVAEVVEGTA